MAALCLNLGGGRWVGEWWVAIAIVGGTPPFYGYALFALALPLLPICISHPRHLMLAKVGLCTPIVVNPPSKKF